MEVRAGVVGLAVLLLGAVQASAANLTDTQKLLDTGKYGECIAACDQAIPPQAAPTTVPRLIAPSAIVASPAADDWWVLKTRAQLLTGKYPDADKTSAAGLASNPEKPSAGTAAPSGAANVRQRCGGQGASHQGTGSGHDHPLAFL